MTLGTATLLLLLALGGIAACRVCLRKKRSLRRACVAALSVLALALIVYIGLTVLLVGAVQSQPPVLKIRKGSRHSACCLLLRANRILQTAGADATIGKTVSGF